MEVGCERSHSLLVGLEARLAPRSVELARRLQQPPLVVLFFAQQGPIWPPPPPASHPHVVLAIDAALDPAALVLAVPADLAVPRAKLLGGERYHVLVHRELGLPACFGRDRGRSRGYRLAIQIELAAGLVEVARGVIRASIARQVLDPPDL